jgi:hypothetical protein
LIAAGLSFVKPPRSGRFGTILYEPLPEAPTAGKTLAKSAEAVAPSLCHSTLTP